MKNAKVTANKISVRIGPGQQYTKLGEYTKDDIIIVLDDELNKKYAKVLWQAGYAYSNFGEYIKFDDDIKPLLAVVTANRISVRKGRNISYAKLGELENGDKITVLDKTLNHEYLHIDWQDTDGYAFCEFGKHIRLIDELSNDVRKTLDIVKSCVGGQYIYGAQGNKVTQEYVNERYTRHPEYFTGGRYEYILNIAKKCDESGVWEFPADYAWDCSGLWWYSANKAEIYDSYLDTTADTFYNSYCTPINKNEIAAGDCVFYSNDSDRITHMGIVGENGEVYEAMSGFTGVVTCASVDDRTAQRVVGSGGTYTKPGWNAFGRPKIFE